MPLKALQSWPCYEGVAFLEPFENKKNYFKIIKLKI